MTPVTYGYARVSKTDDATRNPETQLQVLQECGIREEHIFTGGNELMTPVQPNDSVGVDTPFSAPSIYPEPEASTAAEETDGKRPACVNTAW